MTNPPAPPSGPPRPWVRALCLAAVLGATAVAAGLWWDWWVFEFARSEPWRAALSWWGDGVALLTCLWAIGIGSAWTAPADRDAARWATVGVTLSLLADCGVTASLLVADARGSARAVPAIGQVAGADGSARIADGQSGQIRLRVRFPLAGGGVHEGRVALFLGRNQPGDLPPDLRLWLGRTLSDLPGAAGPPPAVAVRYDPAWPGRFWLAKQEWGDLSVGRLSVCMLPLMQLALILFDPLEALLTARRPTDRRPEGMDELTWATTGPCRVAFVSLPLLIVVGLIEQGWM